MIILRNIKKKKKTNKKEVRLIFAHGNFYSTTPLSLTTRSIYIRTSFILHLLFTFPILALAFPTHALHSFSWAHALTFCRGQVPPNLVRMEEGKSKYSLFPAPPLSRPFSSLRQRSHATQEPLTPNFEDSTTPQERSPPQSVEPLPAEPGDLRSSPRSSHPDLQFGPPSQEQPASEPDSSVSPGEMTASSCSTASESSLKPAPMSLASPPQQPWSRPRRAFVRHGLGGAGNYHKRPNSIPSSNYTGFLSSLLGTFNNKKRKTRQCAEGDSTRCSQYSNQALPLGAAEVLKRKMLGQASSGKRSTSSDRS